ncbi:hypothetical protein FPRO06_08832 [Fusarium proliferatum]|nr:hypothetical protein FPRO06_08832 [Fusarium proliferatum]
MQKQTPQMCAGDETACTRCLKKGLECVRLGRNRQFRDGSSAKYDAKFSGSQNWVNSSAKEFRLQTSSRRATQRIALADEPSSSTENTPGRPSVSNDETSSGNFDFALGGSAYYNSAVLTVLKDFHTTQDGETRELIVTTAVILRHFEELDDEDEDPALDTRPDEGVNFLAILNAVLRSLTSDDLANRRELLIASYWVALRQEVYYALREGYPAQMVDPPAEWSDISPANRIVFHTSQVTKWLFGNKSESGWHKLKEQEEYLEQYVTGRFEPILHQPPDRVLGEVFPTMWYASPIALTGMQHMMIAKMILIAESPLLSQAEDVRAAYRKAEGEVRNLVLQVCGTAVQHPDTQPGLVNAILAIQMYGSYFTDPWEQQALKKTVQMFKDCQAWPLPKALRERYYKP